MMMMMMKITTITLLMSTTFTLPSASAALFSRTCHDDYDDTHDDYDAHEAHNDDDDSDQNDHDHDKHNAHNDDDNAHLCKLKLILLDLVPVHIPQLSVLPNLVWWPDPIQVIKMEKTKHFKRDFDMDLAQTGSPLM